MPGDHYEATARELDTFEGFIDELAEHPDDYTRRNIALLARDYFGPKAPGMTLTLDTELGVIKVAMPAATPEPAPATTRPEQPAPRPKPGRPAGRVARSVPEGVEAARREWRDTYGIREGATLVSVQDGAGDPHVVDAHLRTKGDAGGLDEQARRELAALPGYGQEGWGKRHAAAIRQRAAQRAAQAAQPTGGSRRDRELAAAVGDREDMNWGMIRAAVKAGKDLATFGLEVQP